jgi:hypothetical protein
LKGCNVEQDGQIRVVRSDERWFSVLSRNWSLETL